MSALPDDDRADSAWLRRWQEGTVRASGANAPVLLSDPDAAWLVESGSADVFLVPLRDGEVAGVRRYLWSVGPGDVACGAKPLAAAGDPDGRELGLLAVGTAGTRLRQFSLASLQASAAADPQATAALAGVIERYLAGISGALVGSGRPQFDVVLAAVGPVQLQPGRRAGTSSDPVWVRHNEGSSLFCGVEELVVDADDAPLPLGPGLFLVGGAGGARLEVLDPATCRTAEVIPRSLALLRALLMAFAARLSVKSDEEDLDRIAKKEKANDEMRWRGLAALQSVLARHPIEPLGVTEGSRLLAVCRLLGDASQIEFTAPQNWETAGKVRDELGAICRASRVRNRRVALRDDWWRHDAGPLLGFLSSSLATAAAQPAGSPPPEPVALVPDRSGGYRHLDPAAAVWSRVDARFAAQLEPFAYSFYRPLPDEPIGALDLLRIIFRGLRRDALMVLTMALGSALLGLALPLATGKMFSSVIPSARDDQVVMLFVALVAVNLGAALFDLTRAFALVRIEGRTTGSLQAGVIDRLLGLPVPFFRRFSTGDLTQRALGINTARSMLSGAAITSVLAGIFSLTNLGLMFYYDWRLALVAVAMLFGVVTITTGLTIPALRAERRRIDVQGKIAGLVYQLVGGVAKLRIAAAEARGFSVWATRFHDQKKLAYRARSFQNAIAVLNSAVPLIATLSLFSAAVWLIEGGGDFNTGQFIAFNAAFGVFFAAGVALSNTLIGLLNVKPVLERARPILEAVPEVDAAKPDPGELTGRIEASHLKFRYFEGGPLVLDDVTFETAPGEFIALVGPSGSGKSTILRLLLGFEEPENGAVYYDGQDLAALDHSAVRSQIGVVLQGSRILAGDIFTNLVGSSPLTLDDAWAAAEAAGVADDIKAMPMGMQTVISEGGGTISGGQRQRLLIARALVRRPRVILFDEATSALDNRTQAQVTASLDQLHTTRIVIAHRLSTIRHADRIYVVAGGRIVQSGNFDELTAVEGLFADLIRRQIA